MSSTTSAAPDILSPEFAADPQMTDVVVLGTGVAAADPQEFCAAALARFKVPRHVSFVTDWPMSATKIQKGPLRQQIDDELKERA